MKTFGHGVTNTGKLRDKNEDVMVVDDALGVYLICDGIGGRELGDLAAETAAKVITEELSSARELLDAVRAGEASLDRVVELGDGAFQKACAQVHALSQRDDVKGSVGCTATLLIALGRKGVVLHVGNTRLYLYRKDAIHQLSTDHTMASELVQAGVINQDEAYEHPYSRILTRAIGSQESVIVDSLELDIFSEDRLLLCSNGLGSYINDPTPLIEYMADGFDDIAKGLIAYAEGMGGSDDITVVVVRTEDDDGRPTKPPGELDAADYFSMLDEVPLFEKLGLVQLQRLLNISEVRFLSTGEVLVEEGVTSPGFFLLLDGSLELMRGESKLGELKPGETAGTGTLISERQTRASLRATAISQVLVIEREAFQDLTHRLPRLGVTLLDRLGQNTSHSLERAQSSLAESAPDLEAASLPVGELL